MSTKDEEKGREEEEEEEVKRFTIEEVIEIENLSKDAESIRWVGTQGKKLVRIDSIGQLTQLKNINLRSNMIVSIKGIEELTNMTNLELYDNQVKSMKRVANLTRLSILDMSFNRIKRVQSLDQLVNLRKLYLANNRLTEIPEDAFKSLRCLEVIDLGANRIRKMGSCFNVLENLKELWLGKNKIEKIEGIEMLKNLVRLDVQSNRLTSVESLPVLQNVEELYLSHNAIISMNGVQRLPKLKTLDMSNNRISKFDEIDKLLYIEEFWMNNNPIESFDEVKRISESNLKNLKTIYLQHCPIAKEFAYRKRVATLLPHLKQLDADFIVR